MTNNQHIELVLENFQTTWANTMSAADRAAFRQELTDLTAYSYHLGYLDGEREADASCDTLIEQAIADTRKEVATEHAEDLADAILRQAETLYDYQVDDTLWAFIEQVAYATDIEHLVLPALRARRHR